MTYLKAAGKCIKASKEKSFSLLTFLFDEGFKSLINNKYLGVGSSLSLKHYYYIQPSLLRIDVELFPHIVQLIQKII